MRRLFIGVSIGVLIFAVLLFFLPNIAAWQLQKSLGSRPAERIAEQALRDNTNALLALSKPIILVDIPTDAPRKAIEDKLTQAASSLELPGGWKLSLTRPIETSFLTSAIRGRIAADVENVGIGKAALEIGVDAIPHIKGQDIVFDFAVMAASINHVTLRGLRLPWPVPQVLTEAVQKSLDALNSQLKPVTVQSKIPPALITGEPAAALMISRDAIAVLVGPRTNPPRIALAGGYEADFISQARTISPDYSPGSGLIAVASSANTLPDTSEALRQSSIAANLAATRSVLGLAQAANQTTAPDDLSAVLAATVRPSYFEQQMNTILRDAISKLNPSGVELIVRPEDIITKTIEGALEATAKGTANFADGAISIDFSLTAWGVVDPSPVGLRARYAVRDFQIRRMTAKWKDLKTSFKLENAQALASLVLKTINELPDSTLAIPPIKIALPKQDGSVRVEFAHDASQIDLKGRSTLLAPDRIMILSVPVLTGSPDPAIIPVAPDSANYDRLRQLNQAVYKKVFLNDPADALNVGMTRAAVARLINNLWVAISPSVVAQFHQHEDIPKTEVTAIPGDASCNSMCPSASSCGDVLSCKINVCNVVSDNICGMICPGGNWNPICHNVCKTVNKTVCHQEDDNSCLGKIQQCVTSAGTCAATWASGLRLTCEAALATIKATDFRGLANISGRIDASGSGKTFDAMKLAISPDLGIVTLQAFVSAAAHVDASLDITWTDFGNFLACPSGKLSAGFDVSLSTHSIALPTMLSWSDGGDKPLKLTVAPSSTDIHLAASESPLVTLARSNPGLLTCGLGQAVVGLSLLVAPSITQNLLAGAIRKIEKKDNSTTAAIIDGKYTQTVDIKPIELTIPGLSLPLNGKEVQLLPRLTSEALIFAAQQ